MALPGLVAAKNLADVADKERAWDSLGQQFTANFDTFPIALAPGTPLGGGFFAGFISHTANGSPTHALIVAPRATGATGSQFPLVSYTLTAGLSWKTSNTTTAGASSDFDGAANTAAMVTAGIADHPAAQFCVNLSIGGFTDWYLPSRFELDIAYFNLKPSADVNNTFFGINPYSVPQRTSNNTPSNPGQTASAAFSTTTEGFMPFWHWSSTDFSEIRAYSINFANGAQSVDGTFLKTASNRLRAFRRIAL
jgi:hypothetical protein